MGYTNSGLVAYKKLSPNHSGQRTHSIDRITPHCVVGQISAESLGDWFARSSTQASSNYGINKDGRVGLYVEEKNRSWCSSSNANDQRAITIECASDTSEPYAFRDVVYKKLITPCVDICKRNGKKKLLWLGGKGSTAADKAACENYAPKSDLTAGQEQTTGGMNRHGRKETAHGAFAQEESHSHSENVKWGKRKRAMAGNTPLYPPYGYRKSEDGTNMMIVPEEAEVVRFIFDSYEHGMTIAQIRRILRENGTPRPMIDEYRIGNWEESRIWQVLNNVKYMGDIVTQKRHVGTCHGKRNA